MYSDWNVLVNESLHPLNLTPRCIKINVDSIQLCQLLLGYFIVLLLVDLVDLHLTKFVKHLIRSCVQLVDSLINAGDFV